VTDAAVTSSVPPRQPVRRALVSVYDKTGLVELAQGLQAAGVELVSTGSTAARIAAAGIPVTSVEQLTGFPECLDGRVKTLHPRVHAGILADRRLPSHVEQLAELGIEPFDLVVVNLYPFRQTVASGASPDACVEQIDIGGPSMVRAAAKNHPSVAVVVDPARYDEVLAAVAAGGFTLAQRKRLAADAFVHTATYDIAVASWMGNVLAPTDDDTGFPAWTGASWDRAAVLRYGENPHQRAALYRHWRPGLAHAEQLHGKEMSYNNYVDTDAAWRAAHDHGDAPTVAIIKHANPCGIAVGADVADAYCKAFACDPVSAYGGVVAVNGTVTQAMAEAMADVFTEVIAAAGFEDAALDVLTRKKNVRLLRVPSDDHPGATEIRVISGGLLVQERDRIDARGDDPANWTLASGEAADDATLADLQFAWRAIRAVKSNAILIARDGASVGVGMGQVNRVDSCKLAVARAGD
jgi:phosphoribosylaminoimidazolecarboxamide formyltransferase/IMP cyclohydrolase